MGGDKTETVDTTELSSLSSTQDQSTTGRVTNQAFAPAIDPLTQIIQQAGAIPGINQAQASSPFFQQGINQLTGLANQPSQFLDPATQFATGAFQGGQTGINALQQQAGQGFQVSPEFQQVLDARLGDEGARAARLNASFGRSGSPAAGQAIASRLGDISSQALLQESQRQGALGQQAALGLGQFGQGATGQLPTIFSAQQQQGLQSLQLDQLLRGEGQRQISEPLANLQQQLATILPTAQAFGTRDTSGTTTGTSTQIGDTTGQQVKTIPNDPLGQAIGLGLAGASLFVPGAGGAASAAGNIAGLFGGGGLV